MLGCDLDGVVWLGDAPIAGSVDAIARFRRAGWRVAFVTNNSAATRATVAAKLTGLGIAAEPGDVVSSASAAGAWCREELDADARILCCAGPGVREALTEAGFVAIVDAGAQSDSVRFAGGPFDAVVCGWHREFDFDRLANAADALHRGARFIVTNEDATYPTTGRRLPGNGALVAAIATAAGRVPEVVTGKPHAPLAELVVTTFGPVSVMVGDRPSTDGAFARRLGCGFALVLSGVAGAQRENDEPIPDPPPEFVAADLAGLADLLLDA